MNRAEAQKIADCLFWSYDKPMCVKEPEKLKSLLGKVKYENVED